MQLNGLQHQQLQNVLISTFPTLAKLTQMISFQLNENLSTIASGQNLAEVVFGLISWAESEGRLEELVGSARASNQENQLLREFAGQVGFPLVSEPQSSQV